MDAKTLRPACDDPFAATNNYLRSVGQPPAKRLYIVVCDAHDLRSLEDPYLTEPSGLGHTTLFYADGMGKQERVEAAYAVADMAAIALGIPVGVVEHLGTTDGGIHQYAVLKEAT